MHIAPERIILADVNRRQFVAWVFLILCVVASVRGARAWQARERARLPLVQRQEKTRGGEHPILEITAFSDFQCPACAQSAIALGLLHQRYPTQLRLHFRHHPLEKPHRWAMTAAVAAECAAQQQHFWVFHDLLYARQALWSSGNDAGMLFKTYAQELRLNRRVFDRCLDERQTLPMIREDLKEGQRWDVNSTPTMIVNNGQQRIVGVQMLQQVLPQLEARLQGQMGPQ